MVPPLAKELAANITAGTANKTRLVALSMVPPVVTEIAAQIAAEPV
jgi:hypothetical protein